ncbi:DNA polymerase subunit gamma-1-like protein [Anopheles sinensis]|uniref:DNA polymerase subunit gamma-1-like protein n=1 Tax=Anopheles sinensis TaxID=74873 RepID=A0A084VJ58_ANOSI|nr:DNA polymerase subunit gamma-1-like protein [Anopheles sinensis]
MEPLHRSPPRVTVRPKSREGFASRKEEAYDFYMGSIFPLKPTKAPTSTIIMNGVLNEAIFQRTFSCDSRLLQAQRHAVLRKIMHFSRDLSLHQAVVGRASFRYPVTHRSSYKSIGTIVT